MNAEEIDNILLSVKRYCGIEDSTDEDSAYTNQIVTHINTVFMILNQLGVGPEDGFKIVDGTEKWSDFKSTGKKPNDFNGVEDYMNLKVKVLFDPQSFTPNAMEAANKLLAELEWRLNYRADANRNGLIS